MVRKFLCYFLMSEWSGRALSVGTILILSRTFLPTSSLMTLMQFIQKEKVKREEKSHKYNNKASYTSDVSEPTTFWLQKRSKNK